MHSSKCRNNHPNGSSAHMTLLTCIGCRGPCSGWQRCRSPGRWSWSSRGSRQRQRRRGRTCVTLNNQRLILGIMHILVALHCSFIDFLWVKVNKYIKTFYSLSKFKICLSKSLLKLHCLFWWGKSSLNFIKLELNSLYSDPEHGGAGQFGHLVLKW